MNDGPTVDEGFKSPQLLRALLVGKLGSWEVDLSDNRLSWSDMALAIFEIDEDDFAGTEDAFFAMVHPDDLPALLEARQEWLDRGGDFLFEHRILTPAGKVKWVIERAQILKNEAGEPAFTTGTVQDVTDLKLAEQARSAAEEALNRAEHAIAQQSKLLRLAGEIGKLGGWRYDVDADVLNWSVETARIHGEAPDKQPTLGEAIGYYTEEYRHRIRLQFERCLLDGTPLDEIAQLVTARSRRIWVRAIGDAVRDASGRVTAVEGAFQDITDIISARTKASQVTERLRRTLEGMRDGFYLLDHDWRFQFVNTAAERLLKRNGKDLIGRVIWHEFPAAASNVKPHYERAIREGRSVRFDVFYKPLGIWLEVDADPTPEGIAVYFCDVTELRSQTAQLRLLQAAVAHQNDILLITEAEPIDSPDGPRIVYVNEAFERRTGYTREEVIGRTPRILQGPETQRDELDRIREALVAWQPVRSELINYTKSGEAFWLELDIVPLADESGWYTHWVAIERDISERKQSEEALRANEERFQLVTKAAGNAIWDLDIGARREWWSDGFHAIFGHDPETAPADIWRSNVHPDDRARVREAFLRLLSGQDTALRDQYRFQRADGSWALIEDNAFALRDSDGKVMRILGAMTDVTERHQLEERLHQAQKMEAVGQLTGGVAHDFNNLLTIMLGNAELLERGLSEKPRLQKLARMVVNAADRAAALTSRLLAFSRKQPLQPRVLDVAELFRGLDGLLRRTLPEDIDLEIVSDNAVWNIEADAAQLESAILNLALNARDAMPDGGCLTIEFANVEISDQDIAAEPDIVAGPYVAIRVSDTGHGISAELMERIFEPFFTTKSAGKGSGLGLSMVFGFVKQSGGHVRVYSEVGVGTSLKLYFPRCHPDERPLLASNSVGPVRGGSETILVVEDEDGVRAHVTSLLSGLGYHVLEAPTGAAAMEVIREGLHIDLLFTDVVMPGGMRGQDLATAAVAARPDLKVLFTSGYSENAVVHNGRLDKGVKLLSKPYRRDQLAIKVREILDPDSTHLPS